MVAMNREHGNGHIDIRVFVVDMAESTEFGQHSDSVRSQAGIHPANASVSSLSISSSHGFAP